MNVRADCFSTGWTPPESSISFGRDVDEPLLRLITPASPECEAQFAKLMASLNRLKVQIDYQSMYGEPFQKFARPTTLF